MPRDLFEQRGDFALQALLRAADGIGRQARRGRVVAADGGMICTYQLGASARISRERLPMLLVALQAVEHLEHRQVGFAAGEPLRAAAAADPDRLAALLELPHERLDERRLAHAGLARDEHQARPCRDAARSNS